MKIGRYDVVSTLGKGGMGTVYEVTSDGTERLALKVLSEASPELAERFRREGAILELLGRHDHLVGFRELGEERGRQFLVMELVRGGTLADLLKEGKVDRERALRLLCEAARGLHFAHEAGIVHRDVKPSNVLLDEEGRAVVSDFGVAKKLDAESLTKTGSIVGTIDYMAPEQLAGSKTIDRRADVYALGAILYRILTGEAPFQGPTEQVIKHALMDRPRPPSALARVSPELEAVCMKALSKKPEERQATAEVFAREIEEALAGPSPRGRRPGIPVAFAVLAALAVTGAYLLGKSGLGAQGPDWLWAASRALVDAGAPVPDPILEQLDAKGRGDQLLALRAESLVLSGNDAEGAKAVALLPEGNERSFLEAELRSRAGDQDGAWRSLEKIRPWTHPWDDPGPLAERTAKVAESFRSSGQDARAAAVFLHAAALVRERDALAAAALTDRAYELDLLAIVQAREQDMLAAVSTLLDGAKASLERARKGDVEAARVFKRRLVQARVIEPSLAMPDLLAGLVELGKHKDEKVRLAARPWLSYLGTSDGIDPVLRGEPTADELSAKDEPPVPGNRWNFLEFGLRPSDALVRHAFYSEAVLWQPRLSFLWYALAWDKSFQAGETAALSPFLPRFQERARILGVLADLTRRPLEGLEAARAALAAGWIEEALRRIDEIDRADPKFISANGDNNQALWGAEVLAADRTGARARRVLEVLEDGERNYHITVGAYPLLHVAAATAFERLGEKEKAAAQRARARDLVAGWFK